MIIKYTQCFYVEFFCLYLLSSIINLKTEGLLLKDFLLSIKNFYLQSSSVSEHEAILENTLYF